MGHRRDPGVGGEVARGLECGPVTDLEQDPGCSPDPDARHRDQGWGKKVVIEHPLDIVTIALPLQQSLFQGFGKFRQDDLRSIAAGHYHRLPTECGDDLVGQSSAHAGCVFDR